MKPVIAAKAKEKQSEYYGNQYESGLSEKSREVQNCKKTTPSKSRENRTDVQIAKTAGVSENTIRKVEKIQKQAAPEIIEKVQSGEMSINEGYKFCKKKEKPQKT